MNPSSRLPLTATTVRLGIVPDNVCAPITVAIESAWFARYDIEVKACPELGWGAIRDKLYYGELEAAQVPAGIAMAISLGLGELRREVLTPLILSLHGSAITLSTELSPSAIQDGQGLDAFLTHYWRKKRPLTLAAPHRHSHQHILLHTWLRRHGLDPKRDAEVIFLPPALMPRQLKAGLIDGFCAAEPWNSVAILDGSGWTPVTSGDLAHGHPGHVLLVAGRFLREQRDAVINLTTALLDACDLCQSPAFRPELIRILSATSGQGITRAAIENSYGDHFRNGRDAATDHPLHLFAGDAVNRPTAEKASWQLAGLRSIGLLPDITAGSLSRIHREDIYTAARNHCLHTHTRKNA